MSLKFCPRCANLLPVHWERGELFLACASCPFQSLVREPMEHRVLGKKKEAAEIEVEVVKGNFEATGTLRAVIHNVLLRHFRPSPF